jgi:sodium-dependent phosphate cotransporter
MSNSVKGESAPSGSANQITIVGKILLIIGLVYLFVLGVTLLGSAFKLAGKETAAAIIELTSTPIVGLMIGILSTAIVQSSSFTTSLVVAMVAGPALTFDNAIPIIMGANIGTSVTNTVVSLAHIQQSDEFKRAFAGSIVHDFFNLCTVLVLFPLQVAFNVVGGSAEMVEKLFEGFGGLEFSSPLKAITKPVAAWIIDVTGDSAWIAAILALAMLFFALRFIVKTLKSLVLSKVERFFQRYIFRTPVLGFILGILLTVAVQSSSITTSLVVPLIGAGVISLQQIFPYVLGANIGTTITAFLASFATGRADSISVAFAHLFFNIYGIVIFWPLRQIPIRPAYKMAELTQRSKLIPVAYILVVFFAIPGLVVYLFS